jgi:anti-sigma B factor antagonist
MLNIRVTQEHPHFVLSIQGSIDSLTAAQLTQTLSEHLKAGHIRVIADFSGVQYTSSAGLRSLLIGLKEARRLGGDIRLAAVHPSVHKVLSLAGFTSIIKVFATVEAAAVAF